jgi:hypothetical protein
MEIRTLERSSAIFGAFLFALLAVVAFLAKEMTMKEAAFFAVLSAAFGYGWFRLRVR